MWPIGQVGFKRQSCPPVTVHLYLHWLPLPVLIPDSRSVPSPVSERQCSKDEVRNNVHTRVTDLGTNEARTRGIYTLVS